MMKKYFILIAFTLLFLSIGFIHGCKKESLVDSPSGDITGSLTEEFQDFSTLLSNGWTVENAVPDSTTTQAQWTQGQFDQNKGGPWYGFTAYSYTTTPDEYAYSAASLDSTHSFSSWLITPVLRVKNGDQISFYTRGDTTGVYTDRMQVRMDKSNSTDVGDSLNSVGSFTAVLFDINPTQEPAGYPTIWTKYLYTFSGLSGPTETRLAFRHYDVNPTNSRGIGIDVFRFQVN